MNELVWLFLACAIGTYLTRAGGHVILSRFGTINHRVEAALDAVPTAMLAALVAPYLVSKGPVEALGIGVAAFVATRLSLTFTLVAGLATVVGLRFLVG
ncbi:AzlD family protein [Pseudahrensia aquimaris]|uniref:AzlD family protein n=1 Tax=Pseudahrensia aquimaris TaxID=744461 RepID=A0ABW3FDI0_9HYPH